VRLLNELSFAGKSVAPGTLAKVDKYDPSREYDSFYCVAKVMFIGYSRGGGGITVPQMHAPLRMTLTPFGVTTVNTFFDFVGNWQ